MFQLPNVHIIILIICFSYEIKLSSSVSKEQFKSTAKRLTVIGVFSDTLTAISGHVEE